MTTSCRVLTPVVKMLLMLGVMMVMLPDDAESHTTCTAVTTIYNTSVTCLFGKNIAEDSFSVRFFPNISTEPYIPLLCKRLLSGRLTCRNQRDVHFDEKQQISDRFTFTRPSSLDKLAGGHYQCQTVPHTEGEVNQYCPLTYRAEQAGGHYQCQTVPPTGGEVGPHCPLTYQDVPQPMLSTPQSPTEEDGDDATQTSLVVITVISLIVAVVMVIIAIILYRKRQSSRAMKAEGHDMTVTSSQDRRRQLSDMPPQQESGVDGSRQPVTHPSHTASPPEDNRPSTMMGKGASTTSSPEKDSFHEDVEAQDDPSAPMLEGGPCGSGAGSKDKKITTLEKTKASMDIVLKQLEGIQSRDKRPDRRK